MGNVCHFPYSPSRDSYVFTLKESQNSPVLEDKADSVLSHKTATMVTEKQAVIVAVREESGWNQQHIPESIHIPLSQLC